jgi:uncharacterized protein YegL
VGVLVFSGYNIQDEWIHPLGPREDATQLQHAIDRIRPNGRTPLGASIKKGTDRLLVDREAQFGYGSYRLLIVTDGEATDSSLVRRYTPDVIARGITMDVIGVAMSQDHTLATQAHSYRRADDLESLTRAVSDVFAEISSDNTTSTSQEEAFALAAAFPPQMAQEVISALARSGNHPVGEQPEEPSSPVAVDAPDTQAPAQSPVPSSDGYVFFLAFGLFVLLMMIGVLRRARKRRHRE